MKKILTIIWITLITLTATAQQDTSGVKSTINSLLPDNTSGAISPEDVRESLFELNRSSANLFERNTFPETIESQDSVKSDQGFFQWNGSGWTEIGSLSDTSLWARVGGLILPKGGDIIFADSIRVDGSLYSKGNSNIGAPTSSFDTVFASVWWEQLNVVALTTLEADLIVREDATVEGKVITDTLTAESTYLNINAADSVVIESGQIVIRDGSQMDGYVLTGDSDGRADWQPNDHGSGWAQYTDTTYDSSNKYLISQGDTAKFPLFWDEKVDSQLPFGVDSLFSRADTTIIGRSGDSYMIRVNFKAEVSTTNGHCDMIHDIGNGSPIVINQQVVTFPRGANTEHSFSYTTLLFSLGTFQSNGCSIKFYAEDGNLELWDFSLIVSRIHKAFE